MNSVLEHHCSVTPPFTMAGHLLLLVLITVCSETKGQVTDLEAPKLSVDPKIITKTGSVHLNCQTPAPVTDCFYSFGKTPAKKLPCRHSVNGSTLLSLVGRDSPGEVSVTCFYLSSRKSPHSERKVISVQDLGPPVLSVHPSVITEFSTVTLFCQPPVYVSTSRCSFYSLTGLKWEGPSCVRTLRGSDLMKNQRPPTEQQLKCYYFENENTSPSPHTATKSTVTVKDLAPPTLTMMPSVITETDTVTLSCQPPSYVSASICYFYTTSGKSLHVTDCVQTLRGSDLLMVTQSPPTEVQVHCLYVVQLESATSTSPHSKETNVTVQTTTTTKTTTTTTSRTTAHLFSTEPTTSQEKTTSQNPVQSETAKAPGSENSSATKNLIMWLTIILTACGATVGCVMLVAAFFCTKKRKDKVKSQDSYHCEQPLSGENNLRGTEPEHAANSASVSVNQPNVQPDDEADPYHPYASIPDENYSSPKNNFQYSFLQMHNH
ncbi:mucin-5AC [Boleophthalmus pectinirostris]|uniref:mucin-5AC n=1 Tax=Boleophthalmus pectinirostris TaxID=150288 RepID=UPI00242E5AF7|nr:mucin-5AC [Boleophthalmus pectinirostris]